jgi:putative DNA primase/helicase
MTFNIATPILTKLSDVQPLPIKFLWHNRIPSGMASLFVGDPGFGKTWLAYDCSARVSRGAPWPDMNGFSENKAPLGSVVLLSAEDDIRYTIRPRLDSLGADPNKIVALEGIKTKSGKKFFNLQHDLLSLRQAILSLRDCRLVVIDPLSAYFGLGRDSYKDTEVRSILAPLIAVVEETGVALIMIMHLNKSYNLKAVHRISSSVAFAACARAVWLIAPDPNDITNRRRLFLPAKSNILIEPTGLSFTLKDGKVMYEDGVVETSADQALNPGNTIGAPEKERAVKWLSELLGPGKSMLSDEIKKEAEKAGIKKGTLQRAKEELRVRSFPLIQIDGKKSWFWEIPNVLKIDDEKE